MDDSLLGAELEDDEATAVMEDPNDPAGTPEEVSVGSEAEENAAEASSDDEAPQSPDAASEDAPSEDAEEEAAERGPGPGADGAAAGPQRNSLHRGYAEGSKH